MPWAYANVLGRALCGSVCCQEREKRYMLSLEGLRVKPVEDKLFSKHCFALINPDTR